MSDKIRLALLALLQRLEWSNRNANDGQICPICNCSEGFGHMAGCELDAAIKALKEEDRAHYARQA